MSIFYPDQVEVKRQVQIKTLMISTTYISSDRKLILTRCIYIYNFDYSPYILLVKLFFVCLLKKGKTTTEFRVKNLL